MYDLIQSLKELGRQVKDTITGKTIEDAINNEIQKARYLQPTPILEPVIVLEALRAYNKIKACGISTDELDDMIKKYLSGK